MIRLMHTTAVPLDPRVRDVVIPLMDQETGGEVAELSDPRARLRILEEARASLASLCGAQASDEIVFTSGGTEACNMALKGLAQWSQAHGGRRRLIACATEHTAVLYPLRTLGRMGFDVHEVPVDAGGVVDLDALESLLRTPTLAVSVAPFNAETGTRQPLETIVDLARGAGALVHIDACLVVAYEPLRVAAIGVDLASISAPKIGGPPACGALYVRRGVHTLPLVEGGTEEGGRRGGAFSLPAIAGFGTAARYAADEVPRAMDGRERLARRLERGILALPGLRLHGPAGGRAAGLVNVSVIGCDGEALVTGLARRGILVSSGSSCSREAGLPSHVLTAMGCDREEARGSVLFALGRENGEAEIDTVVNRFREVVDSLRAIAPAPEAPER